MAPANVLIQSTTIDLLQAIVARGEIDLPSLQNVQAAVIGKLYLSVHTHRLELQNKLLHLLHSVISAMTTTQDPSVSRQSKGITGVASDTSVEPSALDTSEDLHELSIHRALKEGHDHHDFRSNTTDSEFIMLLNAIERLVLLSLSTTETGHADEDDISAEKPPGTETGGLFGIVTSVFSSESVPANLEEQLTVRCHQKSVLMK